MILSERLVLRELEQSDDSLLERILLDETIMKFIPTPIDDRTQVKCLVQSLIEARMAVDRKHYFLVVEGRHSGEQIGTVNVKITSDCTQEKIGILGYTVLSDFWGKGYATEASRALIIYLFNEIRIHRVEASCIPDNHSSERVLKKIGMRYEGRKRRSLNIRGIWYDEVLYGILRNSFL